MSSPKSPDVALFYSLNTAGSHLCNFKCRRGLGSLHSGVGSLSWVSLANLQIARQRIPGIRLETTRCSREQSQTPSAGTMTSFQSRLLIANACSERMPRACPETRTRLMPGYDVFPLGSERLLLYRRGSFQGPSRGRRCTSDGSRPSSNL